MTPLSVDALLPLAEFRRQLRDVPGVRELRPGVFVVEGKTLVELFDAEGVLIGRLNAHGRGKEELFRLAEPTRRRALVDAVRLAVKRLQED